MTRSCPESTAAEESYVFRFLLRLLCQGDRDWPLAEQRVVPCATHSWLWPLSGPSLAMLGGVGAAGQQESLEPTLRDKASTGGWRITDCFGLEGTTSRMYFSQLPLLNLFNIGKTKKVILNPNQPDFNTEVGTLTLGASLSNSTRLCPRAVFLSYKRRPRLSLGAPECLKPIAATPQSHFLHWKVMANISEI